MFRWALNLLTGLRNHCTLRTAKRRSAVRHREKQRAKPEIVRKSGLASEFNKIAKMVSKSSKHGKTPEAISMSIFSDRYNFFK